MNEIQLDLEGKPDQKSMFQNLQNLQKENQKLIRRLENKEIWVVSGRVILPFSNDVECGDIYIHGIFSTKRRATMELSKLNNGKGNWYCYECLRERNTLNGLIPLHHTNFEANKCGYGHTLERTVFNNCIDFSEIHKHIIDESSVDEFYGTE